MVGVIGRNGAGKSTLLRLLGGLLEPDEGSIEVNGRVGGILELGAGFHPDLSGRENVYIASTVGGLTRKEVAARFNEIVGFAELERFIEAPLRTYSSGMMMRLAFSVAVNVQPDVLLIDEVLAVGDLAFQRKCLDRIDEFRRRGCTIAVVSHDVATVRDLCDDAVWLERGRLRLAGPAGEVARAYVDDAVNETVRRTPPTITQNGPARGARMGSQEVEITAVVIDGVRDADRTEVRQGDPLSLEIEYFAREKVTGPVFHVSISDKQGQVHLNTATDSAHEAIPSVRGRGAVSLRVDNLDLEPGEYHLSAGVYDSDWRYAYDYRWDGWSLEIRERDGSPRVPGGPRPRWALA
jgi:lipopolysaccharide transport system ATP-binding protein